MKIGIDVRELAGEKAGKGWYVYRLLEQLATLDAKNEYVLYAREGFDVPRPRSSQVVLVDSGGFSWHRAVAKRLQADGVELFFAPLSLIIPALTALPTVLVIYDLTALTVSGKHTWKSRLIEKLLTGRALKKSRRILAISDATRRDILKLFPRAAGKVVVTPLGVDGIFRVLDEEHCRPVWERYGLKTGYLLFVGTLEPRKNVANLIDAYGRLEEGLRDQHPLVIVGKKGWFYGEIFRKVRELSLEERVRFLGYLPEEELPAIYNGAGVFLYPSWYEGFGLPVLEAMACGVPVITSDSSSLPEVAGEETILVNPGDVEELKNGIELILTDREKARRVREEGIKRASEFTWRKTAELTLETMEKVGEEAKS